MNSKGLAIMIVETMISATTKMLEKAEITAIERGISVSEVIHMDGNSLMEQVVSIGELINEIERGSDEVEKIFEKYERLLEKAEQIEKNEASSTPKEKPLDKIIKAANEHLKKNFMDYPDYDESEPVTTLEEAFTIFIMEALPEDLEVTPEEVYDYLTREK